MTESNRCDSFFSFFFLLSSDFMSDVESGSVCQETPCQQSRNSQEKQSFFGVVMTPSAQVCMARFPTFVF